MLLPFPDVKWQQHENDAKIDNNLGQHHNVIKR